MIQHLPEHPILRDLRDALHSIFGDNLSRLILYGSRDRGDAYPDSDVDVLIVLKEFADSAAERERIAPTVSALSLEYDLVIACHVIHEPDYLNRQSPLLINIRREGVTL